MNTFLFLDELSLNFTQTIYLTLDIHDMAINLHDLSIPIYYVFTVFSIFPLWEQ